MPRPGPTHGDPCFLRKYSTSQYLVALLSHIVLVLVFNPLNFLLLHCQVAGKELPLHYCACEIHMQDLVYLCTHLNWAWHNEMAMVSIVHVRQYRIMSHAVLPVNDRDWLWNHTCMVVYTSPYLRPLVFKECSMVEHSCMPVRSCSRHSR